MAGVKDRILNKVDWSACAAGHTCWEFLGYCNKDGYARINKDGRNESASRCLYEEYYQCSILPGIEVCHTCDNPSCVNIHHLRLGTHTDNMREMYSKGRRKNAKGEKHPRATLTDNQVIQIRQRKRYKGLIRDLAKEYGISYVTVGRIYNNKSRVRR